MKNLLLAVMMAGVVGSVGAENATFDTNTMTGNIPLIDVNGVTTMKDVKLKYRSDGLLEIIGYQQYIPPPPPVVEENKNGKWVLNEETNPVNDSKKVTMALASESGAAYGKNFTMYISCNNGVTDFLIDWVGFLGMENQNVTYRIDSGLPITKLWTMSKNNSITYFSSNVPGFIGSLFNTERFAAETNFYTLGKLAGLWDITGIENAIVPLRQACNW